MLHVVGPHPGGMAVDYLAVAVISLSVVGAFFAIALKVQQTPPAPSPRGIRTWTPATSVVGTGRAAKPAQLTVSRRDVARAALSYLLLAVIAVQGFHVVEHVVLVVQVHALGMSVAEAHGLLGARVDFEWLHFSYNASFLGALALLLAYGRRPSGRAAPAAAVQLVVMGAVGLQAYHVFEHVTRIVQYLNTGCTPCIGLIGHVVLFIWPHLFFGLFAYAGLLVGYVGYGLHRHLRAPATTSGPWITLRDVAPAAASALPRRPALR